MSVTSQGKQGKHMKINTAPLWPPELAEHIGRAVSLLGGMSLQHHDLERASKSKQNHSIEKV